MILVAIGANLPDRNGRTPLATCQNAARALGSIPGLAVGAVSGWFLTAPQPPAAQPDYVNGVVRLSGTIAPEALLASLQAFEARSGRSRAAPNAARPLDLDIIAMGNLVRERPDPVLPHPRAHLRRFVLVPLAEVAPGWVHPVLRRSVEELIAALPQTPIRVA